MHPDLDAIRRALRRRLEALYGERLERLVLYGSQARGDARRYSDIDVLVVLDGEVNSSAKTQRTSDIRRCLSLKYDTLIAFVYVSVARFEREQSPLLLNVRQEGVTL